MLDFDRSDLHSVVKAMNEVYESWGGPGCFTATIDTTKPMDRAWGIAWEDPCTRSLYEDCQGMSHLGAARFGAKLVDACAQDKDVAIDAAFGIVPAELRSEEGGIA